MLEISSTLSRRTVLAASAAAGAVNLLSVGPAFAAAAERSDKGKPGEGGFGRSAVQLPPGSTVAVHDPKDIEAMPEFKYSLDGGTPKITSGGWAKESTIHQLPVSKGLAGVHMFLNPGASRELHWHAFAAEWAFVIEGRCQTMVTDPTGASEINNYEPGDLWYFPKGHGHSIQCIGDKPCHFILSFDNGAFSEHGTFSITDWIDVTPKDILAANFNLPKDARDAKLRVFYAMHHRYRPGDDETWKYIAPIQKAAWSRKTFEYGIWGSEFRAELVPREGEIVASERMRGRSR